ncbi:urease accessory protein UreD [Acetobacteraceae bacterium H6797]|nr:urease accessory protein UreD [Acetobacteraceae bacterium H6797]
MPTLRHQRARGGASLGLVSGPHGTRIDELQQASPQRLLFPSPEPGEWLTAAMVNTAGGLAGGDAVTTRIALGPEARATLSAAAAEKIYRSLGPETEIGVTLDLAENAALEWIPQETIFFSGARLRRRIEARLAPGARLIMAEALVFGRAAHGETVVAGSLVDQWRIIGPDGPLWAEGLRLGEDIAGPLQSPFGMAGAGAMATLLLVAPEAEAMRDRLRLLLEDGPVRCGATLPRPGLMLARFLGEPLALRGALSSALSALREGAFGLPARLPRLWTT